MNVLYVIHNLGPDVPESKSTTLDGGCEGFSYALAHHLSTKQTAFIYYVDVENPGRTYLHKISNFRNEFLGEFDVMSGFQQSIVFNSILEDHAIDLIHYQHLIHSPMEYAILANARKIPQILSVHDYYYICEEHFIVNDHFVTCGVPADITKCAECLGNKYEISPKKVVNRRDKVTKFLGLMDEIILPSKATRHDYFKIYPELNDVMDIIPIGIKPRDFIGIGDKKELVIGIPNYLSHIKGFTPMMQVIRLCNHYYPQIKFKILTRTVEEKQFEMLRKFPNVELCPEEFDKVNLIWLPTIAKETFSLILSEAMTMGIPVAAYKKGAIGDRLTNEIGFPIDVGRDVNDIAQMFDTISRNLELLEKKSLILKEKLDTVPTLEFSAACYADRYRKLLRRPNERPQL